MLALMHTLVDIQTEDLGESVIQLAHFQNNSLNYNLLDDLRNGR